MSRKYILFLIEKVLSGTSSKKEEEWVDSVLWESFISSGWNEDELGNEEIVLHRIVDQVNEVIQNDGPLRG